MWFSSGIKAKCIGEAGAWIQAALLHAPPLPDTMILKSAVSPHKITAFINSHRIPLSSRLCSNPPVLFLPSALHVPLG